ncbi:DUF4867 family protein [Entomospira entomophila]|uniref:DUF4867 family protein n=1 Tax=Entomospira entomophila TaxID=2719988 RepID=A0A968G9C1_9SPIO|nr:DUF4867 family protein [Entomospira entomophilus]NIZ40210.1 DUF4867 family protein [Entomospira entomophilus]WDI35769.1 DUF4867 family protein [Entomospira entomophilus]
MLNHLRSCNQLPIFDVESIEFKKFGQPITGYDYTSILQKLDQRTTTPNEGNIYVASSPELEDDPLISWLTQSTFGGMPIQIGYCNGKNEHIANGLEYHKGSEVIITLDDIVLALGHAYEIENRSYDIKRLQYFYIPANSAVELYANTLHLSPIRLQDSGFKSIIVLPRGTNTPLPPDNSTAERDPILLETNKWILAHPLSSKLIARQAYVGLVGDNVTLKY